MLPRKYVIKIAKCIRDSGMTMQQRTRIANKMGEWIFEDNPAVNLRAFKIMANSNPDDVQDLSVS